MVPGTPVEDVKLLVETVSSLVRANALRSGKGANVSFGSKSNEEKLVRCAAGALPWLAWRCCSGHVLLHSHALLCCVAPADSLAAPAGLHCALDPSFGAPC